MFRLCSCHRFLVRLPSLGPHRRNTSSATTYKELTGKTVRIGCSSGFWGDTAVAAPQLVHHGNIDFLVADYLSEITMSLLTAARRKNPEMGYTPDFIRHCIKPLIREIKQKGIRVVANAGGVNLLACTEMVKKVASEEGINLSVAMVTGDDLMKKREEIRDSLYARDLDTGARLPDSVLSLNAYLGAFPIADALDAGADVVVTGRCVDSALALGPLVHMFDWKKTDLDLLAAGSLAGHLIECGAQVTGGIFTDWDSVEGWDNIGFPVVECSSDGRFVVTKPPGTGGLVSTATVSEQLVYEIGDPANYTLPDVSCDFSQVKLTQLEGEHSVLVEGAKGRPPTPDYKVSATYLDGFRATAVCTLIGPRAVEKARKTANSILKRTRRMFQHLGYQDYSRTNLSVIGAESCYGLRASPVQEAGRDAVLWLAAHHQQKGALELLSQEIAPAGTGMAPGLTGLVGGRPKVSPLLRLFSFLYPKEQVPVTVVVDGKQLPNCRSAPTESEAKADAEPQEVSNLGSFTTKEVSAGTCSYRLEELAYLRSGDKGNSANIGVIARKPEYYPYLKKLLTAEVVAFQFAHLLEPLEQQRPIDLVHRYELPGISGLNFVLKNSLGGGGISSLNYDPQGKGYGQMLADYELSGLPSFP